jgi:predicted RNA-binding Zn ribbon-like protein
MSATSDPQPFRFVGGHPGLDLVNTVDWTRKGPQRERLTGYERVTRWAEGAGLVSIPALERLRRAARSRPEEAAAAYRKTLELRSFLQRLFRSVIDGRRSPALWRELDERLSEALGHLGIEPAPGATSGAAAVWAWSEPERRFDSPHWPLLRSVADLLTSLEARRIRVCDGPDCGWMYVDRSRNHLRRWCEMETCGTAAKTRRRRERSRRGGRGA